MKAVLQRVRHAEVTVDGAVAGRIDSGLLVYVGVAVGDTHAQARAMADKIAALRIFTDPADKMNLSVRDVGAGLLVVPNFTLQADARKGRRPAFVNAARPEQAHPLFDAVAARLGDLGCTVRTGVFGAHMLITSQADGPINILLEIPPVGDGESASESVRKSKKAPASDARPP